MQEHFFLQRGLSVAIYAVIAMLFYQHMIKPGIRVKRTLMVYAVILAIMAFFFKPTEHMDLYRLWRMSDYYYGKMALAELFQVGFSTSSSPLGIIYVVFISKINQHLLPALTALLFYLNIFYVIGDYAEKHEADNTAVATVVFLFMSRGVFCEVISGIRCMLAFSFIAVCIYSETYNNKSLAKHLPIYLIAALLHGAALVTVALRLIFYILVDTWGARRFVYLLLIIIIVGLFSNLFSQSISRALVKAEGYLNEETYSYIWEYFLNGAYMIILLFMMHFSSHRDIISAESKHIRLFCTAVFGCCIVLVSVYSIFHRFISFGSFVALPLLIEVIDKDCKDEFSISRRNIMMLSLFMLYASGIKGNLNGIRFF